MKLKRIMLRYYPPGLLLEYTRRNGSIETKQVNLNNFILATTPNCKNNNNKTTSKGGEIDIDSIVSHLIQSEALLSENRRQILTELVTKLLLQSSSPTATATPSRPPSSRFCQYELYSVIEAHVLPLTNCCFNKNGSLFITGSYDRTCKVFNAITGEELFSLEGHENVVYAVAFNNPIGNRIMTGSFDKTCRLYALEYNTHSNNNNPPILHADCLHVLSGCHSMEVVCVCFSASGKYCASGSMDCTICVYDVESGKQIISALNGHIGEIVSLSFCNTDDLLLSGSFDHTCRVWDIHSSNSLRFVLEGHLGEISSSSFNFNGDMIITSSVDRICKLWNSKNGKCIANLIGHTDDILDVNFSLNGDKICSVSADQTGRVYTLPQSLLLRNLCEEASDGVGDPMILQLESDVVLIGHTGEVSKCQFNCIGTFVLTASADCTCRLWNAETGICLQILNIGGHTDEIFSCSFNYDSSKIITASKDNTCRLWTQQQLR